MRTLVLCTTCRYSLDDKLAPDGRTGGEILIGHVKDVLAAGQRDDIAVETQACLWNCKRPCSVIFRDECRFSYVTGDNAPSREQAEALITWFDRHGASETGEVPFRDWPQSMRGHFIARMPPARR